MIVAEIVHMIRLTLICILISTVLYAQQVQEELPDTITPSAAEQVKFYKTLDSVPGDTIYTISSPRGYVIRYYKDYDINVSIALQTKKGYYVFDGCPNLITREFSIDTINLNGRGNNELVIRWTHGMGRGGWIDGWSEQSSGIVIWDLDTREVLFSFQDKYEYQYWWNGVQFDSTGEMLVDSMGEILIIDSLSGGISSCDNYTVDIGYKQITIQRWADCPYVNTDTGEENPADIRVNGYNLTRSGLVLKK